MPQVPVLVHRDDQRAEVLVRALSLEPASNDQLLLAPELDLEPRSGSAPRLVGTVPALGDDPLQFLLACGLQKRLAVRLDVWREVDHRVWPEHAAQQRLALVQRDAEQRLAVQVEQVEDPVDQRNGGPLLARERLGFWPSATGGDLQPPQAGPLLEPAERWPAMLVERHDLAVDHRILRLYPRSGPGQVRKVGRGVLPVARPDPRASLMDDRLDAIPVPLDLEEPVRRAEGRIDRRREHGRDEIRDRCLARTVQLEDAGRRRRRRRKAGRRVTPDLIVRPPCAHACRMRFRIPSRDGVIVPLVEQQPGIRVGLASVLVAAAAGADQGESAAQLLAEQLEFQLASRQRRRRIIGLFRFVGAPVPDDHVPRAVLAPGDHTLELKVLNGVVFRPGGKTAGRWIERWPARHRPAGQHTVHLEAKVVVKAGGPMALHHEAPGALPNQARLRFGSPTEVSLLAIRLQRHIRMVSPRGGHGSCAPRRARQDAGGTLA